MKLPNLKFAIQLVEAILVFGINIYPLRTLSAQQPLFTELPSTRSLTTPSWANSKIQIAMNPSASLSSFSVALQSYDTNFRDELLALETSALLQVQTRGASLQSSAGTGPLLNSDGEAQGDFVRTTVVTTNGETATHILFRLNTGEHFSLHSTESDSYIEAQNHDAMPSCGHSEAVHIPAQDEHDSLHSMPQARATTELTVDVLVLYTPEAREWAGGTAAVESLVQQAILLSNESYTNSDVSLSLNLVHSEEAGESESNDFTTDLSRLAGNGDGYFDNVHELRESSYADMVVLLRGPGEYCGIGFSADSVEALQSGNYAYAVVAANCVDYYSFQHEVGHNLGLQHDQDNAPTSIAYTGSYGYRWQGGDGNSYRSIMAYAPGIRVPYFSNPNVLHEGASTGVVGDANNAATLATVAAFAVRYRENPNLSSGETEEGNTEGGGSSEEAGEPSGEGSSNGRIQLASSITVTKRKKQVSGGTKYTFSVMAQDASSTPVENVVVDIFRKKGKSLKYLKSMATDSFGSIVFTTKVKSGKSRKFQFEVLEATFSKSLQVKGL
ncbi:MAG: hypothetical protein KDD60_01750 [Bdellovibrionales bacterium]|nr:hypothetical protein [Bdellovibrionales bacterium]